MHKQTKKFTLATISALSLLNVGMLASNQVSANERIVLGRDSHGSDINPNSGPFTVDGLRVVGIKGTFATPDKQAIVDRVNAIRKEAYNEGLVDRYVPVKWSTSLEKASLRRAAEASLADIPHHRLTGEQLYGGEYSDNFAHLAGNLAWNRQGLMKAIEQFYDEKQDLGKSGAVTGHYEHMIDPRWTTVAMSAFMRPKDSERHVQYYEISQLFAENSRDSDSLVGEYGDSILYTEANPSDIKGISLQNNLVLKPTTSTQINLIGYFKIKFKSYEVIIPTNRDWSSSDTSVATIDRDGNVTAHKSGTTTITVTSDSKTYSTTVTVSDNASSNTSSAQDIKYGRWIRSGSRWWFKHNDGSYTSNGWEKIDRTWYHFDGSGWMQTGWVKDGSWYYLDGSGVMKTGWLKDNGSWYYLDSSGAMKTGWMKVSGKWYYAYSSGALAINTTTPDGYRVNYNGEWV